MHWHVAPLSPGVSYQDQQLGFGGAPRALGIDAQGREILTYVPGRVVHPNAVDDSELARVARLIREYHVAVASFVPPPDAQWHTDGRDPSDVEELICHNDLAPWNLITTDESSGYSSIGTWPCQAAACGILRYLAAASCHSCQSTPRSCLAMCVL